MTCLAYLANNIIVQNSSVTYLVKLWKPVKLLWVVIFSREAWSMQHQLLFIEDGIFQAITETNNTQRDFNLYAKSYCGISLCVFEFPKFIPVAYFWLIIKIGHYLISKDVFMFSMIWNNMIHLFKLFWKY